MIGKISSGPASMFCYVTYVADGQRWWAGDTIPHGLV